MDKQDLISSVSPTSPKFNSDKGTEKISPLQGTLDKTDTLPYVILPNVLPTETVQRLIEKMQARQTKNVERARLCRWSKHSWKKHGRVNTPVKVDLAPERPRVGSSIMRDHRKQFQFPRWGARLKHNRSDSRIKKLSGSLQKTDKTHDLAPPSRVAVGIELKAESNHAGQPVQSGSLSERLGDVVSIQIQGPAQFIHVEPVPNSPPRKEDGKDDEPSPTVSSIPPSRSLHQAGDRTPTGIRQETSPPSKCAVLTQFLCNSILNILVIDLIKHAIGVRFPLIGLVASSLALQTACYGLQRQAHGRERIACALTRAGRVSLGATGVVLLFAQRKTDLIRKGINGVMLTILHVAPAVLSLTGRCFARMSCGRPKGHAGS